MQLIRLVTAVCCISCGLRDVGRPFLSIVSQFLSDRRQRVRLGSVDVVSGISQVNVLRPLLLILYTPELFHIVGHHMVGYADITVI